MTINVISLFFIIFFYYHLLKASWIANTVLLFIRHFIFKQLIIESALVNHHAFLFFNMIFIFQITLTTSYRALP